MVIEMLLAALLGGGIGSAELVARYRDRPVAALLSPGGLLYVFINTSASVIFLFAVTAAGWRFGLPDATSSTSLAVARVMAAGLGSAVALRLSLTPAQGQRTGMGPITVLNGLLRVADRDLKRKRALSRLSRNDLAGLSFERDHAALAELCCHLMREFDLAEAQRLGGLAAELQQRDDLTDADKLDCWGLELTRLVGEHALRQAAGRLRDRPARPEDDGRADGPDAPRAEPALEEKLAPVASNGEHPAENGAGPLRPPAARTSRLAPSNGARSERKSFSEV